MHEEETCDHRGHARPGGRKRSRANNNPCPGDKAYQVNIIGVPKGKNPTMDNNNGHRIFVPLNGPTNIYMSGDVDNDASNGLQCGSDFRVTDANGTDKNGARLLVPCDNADITNVCYTVFATPLGTPGVPFLKFSSERGPQGDRYESWFWLDPDKVEPGEIKGTIFIETNDPDFPKLSVPVTGTVLPK